MKNITIDQKRTIISWWIFYQLDTFRNVAEPEDIRQLIDEAEDNLEDCDSKLESKYEEYRRQL